MKAEGLPTSLIAKMTGLPEEEIDKLLFMQVLSSAMRGVRLRRYNTTAITILFAYSSPMDV